MEKKTILRVKRQDMVACFTCPICNNLYDRATNISECLHTFCRKCIEDKFIVENLKACPVCNVDLGVAPLDKLRPDNTWDELKLHVFKQKPETVKAAAIGTASTSLKYSRKKKKCVPSLMATSTTVSTSRDPKFDAQLEPEKLGEQSEPSSSIPDSNFRRRPRKNLRPQRNETRLQPEQPHKESENGFHILLNIENEQDIEKEQEQDIEQDNGLAQATSIGYIQKGNNSGKDNEEIPVSYDYLGKSLSTDKEVVAVKSNGTALSGEIAITPNGKAKEDRGSEGDREEVPGEANEKHVLLISDIDTEEVSCEKLKNNGEEKQENVVSTTSGKIYGKKAKEKAYSPPALRPRRQRNMNSENRVEGSNMQVWFSLIAVPNQNTDRPLPQIPSHYIRVKNGNMSVSYVKKYLAYKLGLESEDEVEIWLRQEPVCSTQKLHDLVDWFVQTTPIDERKTAMVGSSGAEFVTVLHYSGSRLLE